MPTDHTRLWITSSVGHFRQTCSASSWSARSTTATATTVSFCIFIIHRRVDDVITPPSSSSSSCFSSRQLFRYQCGWWRQWRRLGGLIGGRMEVKVHAVRRLVWSACWRLRGCLTAVKEHVATSNDDINVWQFWRQEWQWRQLLEWKSRFVVVRETSFLWVFSSAIIVGLLVKTRTA